MPFRHILAAALIASPSLASAQESIPGVQSHYGFVETADGARLETIIAFPQDAETPLNPILFTQWVSCGSIEYAAGSNARETLAALAQRSGLALIRVNRAGAGESAGPSCDALDYDTELQHYVEAYRQLLRDPRIDSRAVYVYGSSLGSTTAPLLARQLQEDGFDIAGVMVQGGGAVTYYERMLNFDRIYLERRPAEVAPQDIHDEILSRARFHYEYLIKGRHPDAVAEDDAAMARLRNDILGLGETDHYGRPFAWHQQAAKHNFLAAWAEIDAPVLVIFNEFDQFETRRGHALIADTVNRLRPGTATFHIRHNIGHSDNRYADIIAAYTREGGEPAWEEGAQIMLDWLAGLRQ